MAYKVIILYQLYMPSYFLGTFTEYPYLSVKYSLIIQKINFPLFVIFIRRSIKKKRTKGRLLFDNHVVVYVQIRDV